MIRVILFALLTLAALAPEATAVYDPTMGRFIQRDPSGYVDGVNLYQYGRSNSLRFSDPTGLISVTTIKETKLDCGGREVRWIFKLDNPAPCDGYIVQKVTLRDNGIACGDQREPFSKLEPTKIFWEAWYVRQGDTTEIGQARFGFTDQSRKPSRPNSKGANSATGEIRFYCKSVTGDLGVDGQAPSDPPSPWGPGKVPDSGDLPSTPNMPAWWNQTPIESGYRNAASVWKCCKSQCADSNDFNELYVTP